SVLKPRKALLALHHSFISVLSAFKPPNSYPNLTHFIFVLSAFKPPRHFPKPYSFISVLSVENS
ncbi:MAG: hypothetical protein RR413_11055, partial [Christensenellaceae bacterium]